MTERRLTADEYLALPLEKRPTQLGFALDVGALLDR